MFKFKQRHLYLILLILVLSIPSYSQESTEEAVAPTETEAPIVTEIVTEAPVTDAPTEEPIATEVVTEAATEEPVVVVTEETVATEAPIIEPTEAAPIATAAPVDNIASIPSGAPVEMLLHYNPNATEASIQEMLRSLGAVELERLPQIGVIRALIPGSVSNLSSANSVLQSNSLANTAGLMSIEPNEMGYIEFTPNDPEFSNQTNFKDSDGNDYSVFMETAWEISPRDGQGVTVAVIDTGLDLQHPEFMGKFVAGWDFYNDDNDPDDDNGHGTHVSGTIAARTNNGVGVAGMAFNAMILPVKVCNAGGICYTYETAAGIIYAVDRGAKVINISLGFINPSTTMQGAINYALSRNVTVVAAAGNQGDGDEFSDEIRYPAYYSGVISVANMSVDGTTIYPNSNSNSNNTVAAPGMNILSTWPLDVPEVLPLLDRPGVGYEYLTGTSMAAPHVAALAAMLIADGVATTPAQIRENLICTSEGKGSPGYDNSFGYGLIQADFALTWNSNSGLCQVSQPNDFIQTAMTITTPPFSVVQPVSTRSVTESASDPTIDAITLQQTLWYKFTPATAGQYMFSTFGSGTYDTMIGVYRGQPGELVEVARNNDLGLAGSAAHLRVSLNKGITYYVMVGTNGVDALQQYMQLNVNPALTATTLQQETASFIRYTGSWNRVAMTGANGGFINTSSDSNAGLSMLVRGTDLNLSRVVGPTQGQMQVFVDGGSIGIFSNFAAVTQLSMLNLPLGNDPGAWHLVLIRNGGGSTPISVDTIQTASDIPLPSAVVGATRLNETASAFNAAFQAGNWLPASNPAAFGGNVFYTDTQDAFVEFRANGNSITIWRATGTGTGQMQIWLDGEVAATIDNSGLPDATSVPYSIANLVPRERVVRVVNSGTGELVFDGAQAITQIPITTTAVFDERSTAFIYSNNWVRSSTTSAVANAGTLTSSTGADNGQIMFTFTGNHFCITHQRGASAGRIFLWIDGGMNYQIDYNPPALNKASMCSYDVGINDLSDTTHTVVLSVTVGTFNFDSFRAIRRTAFTSAMGYITETNPSMIYTGTWTTTTARSGGGARFQGGSARQANVSSGGGQTVAFNINGTGFILYTAIDVDGQAGAFEVYVDDVLMNFTFDGTPATYLDLWDNRNLRFRPVGIGIIDLALGDHRIVLEAIEPFAAERVHFDGIRVLP